jgi:hypothetical protein
MVAPKTIYKLKEKWLQQNKYYQTLSKQKKQLQVLNKKQTAQQKHKQLSLKN